MSVMLPMVKLVDDRYAPTLIPPLNIITVEVSSTTVSCCGDIIVPPLTEQLLRPNPPKNSI